MYNVRVNRVTLQYKTGLSVWLDACITALCRASTVPLLVLVVLGILLHHRLGRLPRLRALAIHHALPLVAVVSVDQKACLRIAQRDVAALNLLAHCQEDLKLLENCGERREARNSHDVEEAHLKNKSRRIINRCAI